MKNSVESPWDEKSSPSSPSYELVKAVKSTAVVKYTAVQTPATFAQLQCNTDLNHPPSNWLSSSAESYGLQSVWSHNTGFSSFRMAHMFPDCVGEVDVVSDAENIKKLLKMPYSHGVISMMVHRIENTLLLDDFDIHKYLLRQAETDWEWLKKFFYENMFEDTSDDKKSKLFHKTAHNSRNTLHRKNLVSKFLYHSLVLADNELSNINNSNHNQSPNDNDNKDEMRVNSSAPLSLQSLEPMLPEPTREDKLPDPNHNHNFTRNVAWTFENIQMLIGTDMPIFGGQTHPCISLRLRDMNKPINVLTGIDYWLDNLMSNVPEVIMCYHLDGIVQKYELIKTEDLPNLDDAQFSPKVIRDIAQNILSFLKNNATKAGHTYWLFKGKDDDFVKLYDLTSLCTDNVNDEPDYTTEKGQNPFTVPVAMLLYRVARNMKYSMDRTTRGHNGTIRMLLKNCIQLLNREKYPQIVTSAHYMLSDLYIPADTDPAKPILVEDDYHDDSATECHSRNQNVNDTNHTSENCTNNKNNTDDNDEAMSATASVKLLMLAHMRDQSDEEQSKYKPPPVSGTVVERCRIALDHVYNGLQCLIYFPTSSQVADDSDIYNEKSDNHHDHQDSSSTDNFKKSKEDKQNMAKPFEAIPMPYYPLASNIAKDNNPSGISCPTNRKKNQKKRSRRSEKSSSNSLPYYNQQQQMIIDKQIAGKALLLCQKSKVETLPTWEAPKKTDNHSWKAHLKALLYEKAALIFAVLAEYEYTSPQCNYGASLRYILNVLKCQKILEIFCTIRNDKSVSYLLGRAGDCCLMAVQDWPNIDKHREAFDMKDKIEDKIVGEITSMENIDMNGAEFSFEALESIEKCLLASYKSYEKALAMEPLEIDRTNLLRRIGNVHNELGVLYMNQASKRCQQSSQNVITDKTSSASSDTSGSVDISWLLTQSLNHLESGIKAFESVYDAANLALLHSNKGRLMRLCAHINVNQQIQERNFYNKALASYQRALQVLGTRKTNPSIWDTVNWDLSTTLFTMATLLQDYPTIIGYKNEEELEREVVEILHKALKHCDTDTPGPKQLVYQFRAAIIHHRLGSLYHRIYRRLEADCDSIKRKTTLQLSKIHYEKAAKIFLSLEQPVEFLTVQLERVALAEYQAQIATLLHYKLKAYQNALDYILQCNTLILEKNILLKKNNKQQSKQCNETHNNCDNSLIEEENQNQEEEKLILLLHQRLQYCLKSLTKLCLGRNNNSSSSSSSPNKQYQHLADVYKQCYSLSLMKLENQSAALLVDHTANLLQQLIIILG